MILCLQLCMVLVAVVLRRVQTTTAPGFAPILWSAFKLDMIIPAGGNPLRGSVLIFAPTHFQKCYDLISDVVFTNSLR